MQIEFQNQDDEAGVTAETFATWVGNLRISAQEAIQMALAHAIFGAPIKNSHGDQVPSSDLTDEQFEHAVALASEQLADFEPSKRTSLFPELRDE